MTLTTERAKGLDPETAESAAWRGMYTTYAEVPASPVLAHYLLDCRPAAPDVGGPILTRGPLKRFGTTGNPGATHMVALCSFYTAGASLRTMRVRSNGSNSVDIDVFDWTAGTWGVSVTAAQVTAAGITVAADTVLECCEFNHAVVLTDGVNVPWTWDGTPGGGLTKLTNAPVVYGRPTVYYGKLFFIKATERDTIVWSEENQANVGYEAGGYNNAWTLSQTGGSPLIALAGTNSGLFYFRAGGIGRIGGAVNADFVTSGVHDSVSTAVGCGHYRTVCVSGTEIWFMDGASRIYYLPQGGEPVDVTPVDLTSGQTLVEPFGFDPNGWRPAAPGTAVASSSAVFTQGPGTGPGSGRTQIWFTVQTPFVVDGRALVFDAETHLAQGYVRFGGDPVGARLLTVMNAPTGAEFLAFGGAAGATDQDALRRVGYEDGVTDDLYTGSWVTGGIAALFIDGPKGVATDVETIFNRLDLVCLLGGDTTFTTRMLSSQYPTATLSPAAVSSVLLVALGTMQHTAVGISTIGRWYRPVIQWTQSLRPSGIKAVKVQSYPVARPARLP